tara:strand:- start:1183 stop:1608 length:426 start_codon:yes stop_codon:yes gene_type:complete
MAAQKGKDVLVKIGAAPTGAASADSYTTVAGLRSTSIALNDEPVDITNKDSSGKRTLLAGAGVTSISVTGSGVFLDSASEATLRTAMGATDFHNFEVVIPDFGTYQGEFMLATLSYSGEYNGESNYDFTLESSGEIIFTAA